MPFSESTVQIKLAELVFIVNLVTILSTGCQQTTQVASQYNSENGLLSYPNQIYQKENSLHQLQLRADEGDV